MNITTRQHKQKPLKLRRQQLASKQKQQQLRHSKQHHKRHQQQQSQQHDNHKNNTHKHNPHTKIIAKKTKKQPSTKVIPQHQLLPQEATQSAKQKSNASRQQHQPHHRTCKLMIVQDIFVYRLCPPMPPIRSRR